MSQPILHDVWRGHRGLAWLSVACVPCAVVVLALGFVDARLITGAPAWNKPLKFFLSGGIYAATFAWYLAQWRREDGQVLPRYLWWTGTVVAAMLAIELVLITMQAARGVPSHFNVGTPFDTRVFNVMGSAIFTLSACHAVLCVALLRARWTNAALLSACRWGGGVTLAGLLVGALMVMPTRAQFEAAGDGRMTTQGSHSVGGSDGGPGLPFLGWSTFVGDRRMPHFVGLHAMQLVPLAVLFVPVSRRAVRRPIARATGLACALITSLAIISTELGRPVVRPGGYLVLLTVLTVVGWAAVMARAHSRDGSETA